MWVPLGAVSPGAGATPGVVDGVVGARVLVVVGARVVVDGGAVMVGSMGVCGGATTVFCCGAVDDHQTDDEAEHGEHGQPGQDPQPAAGTGSARRRGLGWRRRRAHSAARRDYPCRGRSRRASRRAVVRSAWSRPTPDTAAAGRTASRDRRGSCRCRDVPDPTRRGAMDLSSPPHVCRVPAWPTRRAAASSATCRGLLAIVGRGKPCDVSAADEQTMEVQHAW